MKILSIQAKNCSKIEIELSHGALFDTNKKVCLIDFGQDCSTGNIYVTLVSLWLTLHIIHTCSWWFSCCLSFERRSRNRSKLYTLCHFRKKSSWYGYLAHLEGIIPCLQCDTNTQCFFLKQLDSCSSPQNCFSFL